MPFSLKVEILDLKKYSVIDVGTNNILLLLAVKEKSKIKVVKRKMETSALGKDMQKGMLTQAGINRAKKILSSYVSYSKMFTGNIIIIGTSCSREASNINEISDWLKKKYDLNYNVISGDTEAFLIGLANLDEYEKNKDLVLFDVGGGSTEFIYIKAGEMVESFSLQLGIRRLQNSFGSDIKAKELEIKTQLRNLHKHQIYEAVKHGAILVGVGGTVTSLAAIKNGMKIYDEALVDGCKITKKELEEIHYKFLKLYHYELKKYLPFDPARADIINTGILIIKEIVDYLKGREFFVSDRGLQYGVVKLSEARLQDMFGVTVRKEE